MLALLALVAAPAAPADSDPVATVPLLDFADPALAGSWRPVHDRVMGGVSSGRATAVDGATRLAGELSLENNGGFASFRLDVRLPDLSGADGLRLAVRGDGRVYKLGLRTEGLGEDVDWQAPFATRAGERSTVDLAFEDLAPTWRGRLVTEVGPFDPARIRQIGVLIADGQAGPYELEIAAVDAWRAEAESGEPAPGSRAAARARTARLAAALERGADAAALVDLLQWSERVVVVAAPGGRDVDPRASRQIGRLLARRAELADRELRVVHLLGERAGRLAGRTLSGAQVRGLRERWDLPAGEWRVALVGKDGGVKARWSELVEPAEVFALVDGMPMRGREIERRR